MRRFLPEIVFFTVCGALLTLEFAVASAWGGP